MTDHVLFGVWDSPAGLLLTAGVGRSRSGSRFGTVATGSGQPEAKHALEWATGTALGSSAWASPGPWRSLAFSSSRPPAPPAFITAWHEHALWGLVSPSTNPTCCKCCRFSSSLDLPYSCDLVWSPGLHPASALFARDRAAWSAGKEGPWLSDVALRGRFIILGLPWSLFTAPMTCSHTHAIQ